MLELRDITKIYNPGTITETCLFFGFDLAVADGEFLSIVGSNGSGKTSLLNIICGSIPIEKGEVRVGGEDITRQKDYVRCRRIGRVYQNPAMGTCPSLTLLENMSLADNKGKRFGLSRGVNEKRRAYYREQLAVLGLGLESRMDALLGSFSGGQRQAAALVMATLTPVDFLILDEHTAALDPKTAETIMILTDRIVREKKITTMMVTHNLRYAAAYGSRLIMLNAGKIVLDQRGPEKRALKTEDLLHIFNQISIECGN
ncbi:MAG: ATP-binding cassette domain-containing protein [Clostridiaceae bacterium]|nr:ATP-binding cassette domain-containing protein [Clostridiaceae bacterium]